MIRETDVDGVPTFLVPMPGPVRAGLIFRVGQADEELPFRGITHLVEHLALYQRGPEDGVNGNTATTVTQFVVHGCAETVASTLTGICDNLRDIPVQRLPAERRILRIEASGRPEAVTGHMPIWRYGARDFGLPGYPEWGVGAVTADQVAAWALTWFTRQNAALWIAGDEVPAGIRLNLPDGTRRPIPSPSSALPATPAYFTGTPGGFVFDAVVSRSVAARAYTELLERMLFRRLRQESGCSYTTATDYTSRDQDTATVTAVIDALPDSQNLASHRIVDVLRQFAAGVLESADLESVQAHAERALSSPEAQVNEAASHAVNTVTGRQVVPGEVARDQWRALTPDNIQHIADQAMRSILLMAPPGVLMEPAGFEQAPVRSRRAVNGVACRSRGDTEARLVVGTDGVSVVRPDGPVTVRFAECAVLLAWPDGARRLIGADGMTVMVEPTITRINASSRAQIDTGVPAEKIVTLPERDPASIPRVSTGLLRSPWLRWVPGRTRHRPGRRQPIKTMVWNIAVSALFAVCLCVGTVALFEKGDERAPLAAVFGAAMLIRYVWSSMSR